MTANKIAHGGNILVTADKLGCKTDELIDMSSNLTPLGMVPGLLEELTARLPEIAFLPETGSEALCALFAEKHGLQVEQVLAGNGTTEFIYAVPAALEHKRSVIVAPTYGDYVVASRWAGMDGQLFELCHEEGFRLDLKKLNAALTGGELVFICNPNNPTGGMTDSASLVELAERNPQSSFLIDESYISFLPHQSLLDLPMPDNIFVLGSFSKVFGIPGLRLGFLVTSKENMVRLGRRRKPWGVNRIAQIAGEFLLKHGDDYVADVVGFLQLHRPALVGKLAALPGVEVIPGAAHFILCFLKGVLRAEELTRRMLERKVMIRNCENFQVLDDRYFRVSMQNESKNEQGLAGLQELILTKS